MRRIAHISDLHFGTVDSRIAEGLLRDLAKQEPHLVVVSGDLTQRAKRSEFRSARAFLDRIPQPKVIVPGNHDVPLYDVLTRFLKPWNRYRQFITHDMHPFYQDEEIAVAGINTARSSAWKEGRISLAQIEILRDRFNSVPDHLFKVLVSHHPFIPPEGNRKVAVVGRGLQALRMLSSTGCSLILSGHLHQVYSGDVRPYHLEITRSILVAQAGTAISARRRGEANAYNQITLDGDEMELESRAWDGQQFAATSIRRFETSDHGWIAKL
jgi:3',5'-cyclic AMP phosphodiesterase CpdA